MVRTRVHAIQGEKKNSVRILELLYCNMQFSPCLIVDEESTFVHELFATHRSIMTSSSVSVAHIISPGTYGSFAGGGLILSTGYSNSSTAVYNK